MEKIVGFLNTCLECAGLLFVANITGKTDKQIRGIRIVEMIIGTLITTIILGAFGSYMVLTRLEHAFEYQNLYINTELQQLREDRKEDKEEISRDIESLRDDVRNIEEYLRGGN